MTGTTLHRQASVERSRYLGELIGTAIAAAAQFVSKAWRSSSSSGTNSSALS